MKISVARIRLYLKVGKTLADGSHPIMLMVSFNGRKEISTGYSCTVRYWDKKSECIKRGFSNFVIINQTLKKMKDDAISKRDKYIAEGVIYTPQMILDRSGENNALTNDLKSVIEHYIDERGIEAKTIEKWWVVYRSVIKYVGRNILVSELDESFCRRYARWMENEGLSNGSIRSYLGKVGAICHYAIVKGLMSEYPFDGWKYHQDYKESKSELYIHSRSMDVMIEMFLGEVIEYTSETRWRYRDGIIDKLLDIHSDVYAHYLYVVGYYMKGISPTDISMLKKSDIKVIEVKGKSVYAVDGYREKTGQLFKIRLMVNDILSNVLIRTMLMFGSGEYFLPTLNGFNGEKKKRVNNLYTYHSNNLVNWFQKCNEEIARRNVVNNDNIPLIDLSCRYYSYRHSYIQSEIQKPNVNLLKIATATGKSVRTLYQYISLLQDEDLV